MCGYVVLVVTILSSCIMISVQHPHFAQWSNLNVLSIQEFGTYSSINSSSRVAHFILPFPAVPIPWLYCPDTTGNYFFLGRCFEVWHLKQASRQTQLMARLYSVTIAVLCRILPHLHSSHSQVKSPYGSEKQPLQLMRSPRCSKPAIIFILSWKMRVISPHTAWPTSTFVVPSFQKMSGWISPSLSFAPVIKVIESNGRRRCKSNKLITF